jgi:hypothetical protein
MICRQEAPIYKEKKFEMPTIKVIVNDKSVGNNFKEEREDDAVNYGRKF